MSTKLYHLYTSLYNDSVEIIDSKIFVIHATDYLNFIDVLCNNIDIVEKQIISDLSFMNYADEWTIKHHEKRLVGYPFWNPRNALSYMMREIKDDEERAFTVESFREWYTTQHNILDEMSLGIGDREYDILQYLGDKYDCDKFNKMLSTLWSDDFSFILKHRNEPNGYSYIDAVLYDKPNSFFDGYIHLE